MRPKRLWPFLRPLLMIAVFAIALRVLQGTLQHYRYREVMAYLASIPRLQIWLSILLTLAGYLIMTGYDTLAFRYIGHPLAYRRIALASFIGYAFNNNVGLSDSSADRCAIGCTTRGVSPRSRSRKLSRFTRSLSGSASCSSADRFSFSRRRRCRTGSTFHSTRSAFSASFC